MDMVQYEKYQLKGSQDQQICFRQVKENRKLLKNVQERKKRWLGHILRGESLVKEVIEGQIEGKRRKPCIMMLDDIVAHDTYEKIKRRAMDLECWRNWMPITCFQAKHQ